MRFAFVIPSGTFVHANFALSLTALAVRLDQAELVLLNPRSSLIASSRNRGVKAALEAKPDYVLFLDSDMTFPDSTLSRLVAADKDIIGCNYIMRGPPHSPLAFALSAEQQAMSGVAEVLALPTGVLLIKAHVFEKIEQPWFWTPVSENGDIQSEDYYFCQKAREAGFSIWVDADLSLEVTHWGDTGFRLRPEGGYEILE